MEGIGIKELPTGAIFRHEEASQLDGRREIREKRLKEVCADFEAIFINHLLKNLRRTIPESGLNKLPGKDTYIMMFDQKVAEELSSKGRGIGLQEILLRQFGGSY